MMTRWSVRRVSRCVVMLLLGLAVGCDRSPAAKSPPGAGGAAAGPASLGPETSAVPVDLSQGWCGGHGVPESVCTRCNAALIPKFKEGNDWCGGHGLPESQCDVCNPGVAAKWAKLDPAGKPASRSGKAPAAPGDELAKASSVLLEARPRLVTAQHDPLCPVDTLQIRFIDASIVKKAGIETVPVKRRRMSTTIETLADLEFDATRVARVTPRVAGVVRQVAVKLGDQVRPGDPLAVIDSSFLGEAKSRYIERREDLTLAQTDLRRAKTIHDGVRRMLEICTAKASAEEVLGKLEGVRVGEAKGRLLRAHAALHLARADASRQEKLRKERISSSKQQEIARTALAAAEADFRAIREEIAFGSQRDQQAAERAFQVAKSGMDAAKRRLRILGLTEEQVAAVGGGPDELLSRYELRSPVGGRVVRREVAVGEAVEAADLLFVVADTSSMWVMANVYPRDLRVLRGELPVLLTVDGLPGTSFQGRLSWISSSVDAKTRTVQVRAEVPNPDGLLRAGMFGRARIVIHDNAEVTAVPPEAIQTDGCCQLAFVRREEALFVPRKVVLGAAAGGFVEILAGLEEGEMVATTGSFLMKTEILKSNIGAGCCDVDPGR